MLRIKWVRLLQDNNNNSYCWLLVLQYFIPHVWYLLFKHSTQINWGGKPKFGLEQNKTNQTNEWTEKKAKNTMCMRTKWILLAEFQRWDGRLYAEIIWNLNEFLSFWVLWNFVTISKLTIEFFVIRLNQLFQKWKQTNNQRSGTKQKLLFYSFTIAFCCGYQFLSI